MLKGGTAGAAVSIEWKRLGECAFGVQPYRPRRIGLRDGPEEEAAEQGPEPEPSTPPPPEIDVEAIRAESFQKGLAEGERRGADAAKLDYERRLAELKQTLESLLAYKSALRADAERQVLELAFAVARRILRRELTLDPQVALAIIRSCLKDFEGVEVQRIRVSKTNLDMVREHYGAPLEVEVVSDTQVPDGGAVLETVQGRLDARIETQLREIENGLADG